MIKILMFIVSLFYLQVKTILINIFKKKLPIKLNKFSVVYEVITVNACQ